MNPETLTAAWALVAFVTALAGGCASGQGQATLSPYDQAGVLIRNRSQDIICHAQVAPSGSPDRSDRLDPTEVIAPGGSRFFPLPAGKHSVRLLDCNGDVVLARPNVRIGERGVMLRFEER